MLRRVVITGMGVVTGLGHTLEEFWGGLVSGKSGIGPLDLFDTTDFRVHFGGQVRGFDPVALAKSMQQPEIEVTADLGLGNGAATVTTVDLTPGYIDENMRTS